MGLFHGVHRTQLRSTGCWFSVKLKTACNWRIRLVVLLGTADIYIACQIFCLYFLFNVATKILLSKELLVLGIPKSDFYDLNF